MIQTKQRADRSTTTALLKSRNEENFKRLGIMNPYFASKFAYSPKEIDGTEMYVPMFPTEFLKGDVYCEFIDGDNNPMHDKPVLYKLTYNPNFEQEYYFVPKTDDKGYDRYFVPLTEFELVSGIPTPGSMLYPKKQEYSKTVPMVKKEYEDCHYNELTARDHACIQLKVAESNKEWLNNLIKQSK